MKIKYPISLKQILLFSFLIILVPDVHHPVQLGIGAVEGVDAQQLLPVVGKLRKGCVHGIVPGEFVHDPQGGILADHTGGEELLIPGVSAVAQDEDEGAFRAGFQGDIQM